MPDTAYTMQPSDTEIRPSDSQTISNKTESLRPMTASEDQTSINSILPSSPVSTASVCISHVNVTACTTNDRNVMLTKPAESLQSLYTENPFLDDSAVEDKGEPKLDVASGPEQIVTEESSGSDTQIELQFENEEDDYSFGQETLARYFCYSQKGIQLFVRMNILAIAACIYIMLLLFFSIRELNPLRERS